MSTSLSREEVVARWSDARSLLHGQLKEEQVTLPAATADRPYGYIQHLEFRAVSSRCSLHDRMGCSDCDWAMDVLAKT